MMEDNFRNALIIISAIVIGAIFVHGLWTIRKNKNPYKLKAKQDSDFEQQEPKLDRSGFDQDGIGKVKVVAKTATAAENSKVDNQTDNIATQVTSEHQADNVIQQPTEQPVATSQTAVNPELKPEQPRQSQPQSELTAELKLEQEPNEQTAYQANSNREPSLGAIDDINPDDFDLTAERNRAADAVYQAPVTQPKPQVAKPAAGVKKGGKKTTLKRNQMEINFDDELAFDDANTDKARAQTNKPAAEVEIEQEVLVISVIMPEGQIISGAALLPSLLTLGMKYGEMNIFHRHQDNAGNGKVTFSLANMMNPGTFDLDQMESFSTQGISLFMTLPNAGDSFEVFQQMLASAKHLAQEFHGQVLDDKRSVMTKQTEQHYISKIREFERKKRIANA